MQALPKDVLLIILQSLPTVRDLAAAASTCVSLRSAAASDTPWREVSQRCYPPATLSVAEPPPQPSAPAGGEAQPLDASDAHPAAASGTSLAGPAASSDADAPAPDDSGVSAHPRARLRRVPEPDPYRSYRSLCADGNSRFACPTLLCSAQRDPSAWASRWRHNGLPHYAPHHVQFGDPFGIVDGRMYYEAQVLALQLRAPATWASEAAGGPEGAGRGGAEAARDRMVVGEIRIAVEVRSEIESDRIGRSCTLLCCHSSQNPARIPLPHASVDALDPPRCR